MDLRFPEDHEIWTGPIRLVSARACNCSDFNHDGNHHLVFSRKQETFADIVQRRLNSGVHAISYAWGESGRKEHIVGHLSESAYSLVSFELGSEWSVTRFIYRLLQFCLDGQSVWIDRLCLPQKADELRETLLSIPLIYALLPVVVLLPGSYCRCLYDSWREYLTQSKRPADLKPAVLNSECPMSIGACGWNKRIWTCQEFRYARSFRAV